MRLFIRDVQYNVEFSGEGYPLLLLHGFTGDNSTWKSFCQKWGEHSKLIMPDIIGHGKTESPNTPERYNIEIVANDLKCILDQMEIEKVDLLGYSMGGRLAISFAVLYPERVRRLIVESATPGLSSTEERKQRQQNDQILAQFINDKGIEAFVDYWEDIPLFSKMNLLPSKVKESIRMQRLSGNPTGLANSLKGMGTGSQPSWWEHLGQLEMDVLLLTGENDQKFCQIAEMMSLRLKKATWITVKNCGHAIHVEDSEKFGTIVSDFLKNT